MKRRKFITRMTAGAGGGLVFGLTGVSYACTSRKNTTDMVLIPAGEFLMGTTAGQVQKLAAQYGYHPSWMENESPQRKINLPAYLMDRYPVTNEQYYSFCLETGHRFPEHWKESGPATELLDHPVRHVNLQDDALAYAKWAGKRLPTEAEWEKGARGLDGRLFPWGNEFNPEACCWNRIGMDGITTDPVDAHPEGASPYGVMDMSGNLFEWCSDGPADDSQLDRAVKYSAYLKGGGWITTEILDLRPAARGNSGHINNTNSFYGFRCVKEVS